MNETDKEKMAETMREVYVFEQNNAYYQKVRLAISVVLGFVERWNKQDEEKDVAEAAAFLQGLINSHLPQDGKEIK